MNIYQYTLLIPTAEFGDFYTYMGYVLENDDECAEEIVMETYQDKIKECPKELSWNIELKIRQRRIIPVRNFDF